MPFAESYIPKPLPAEDRWLVWPSIAVTASLFVLLLLCGMPGILNFVFIPITFLIGPLALVGMAVGAAAQLTRGRSRIAISCIVAAALPVLLFNPLRWVTDCVHLGLTLGLGLGILDDRLPAAEWPYDNYDWSIGLVTNPNTFLLHDPADLLSKPLTTKQRNALPEDSVLASCAGRSEHLIGRYYACDF